MNVRTFNCNYIYVYYLSMYKWHMCTYYVHKTQGNRKLRQTEGQYIKGWQNTILKAPLTLSL